MNDYALSPREAADLRPWGSESMDAKPEAAKPALSIWILERSDDGADYDDATTLVVVAEDEAGARDLASVETDQDVWFNPRKAEASRLGTAGPDFGPRVILGSPHAISS